MMTRIRPESLSLLAAAIALLAGRPTVARDGFVATRLDALGGPADAPLRLPTAVAVSPVGELYVVDGVNNRIVVFASDGGLLEELDGGGGVRFEQPVGIDVDATGRAWIADSGNQRVVVLSPQREFERSIDVPAAESGRPADVTDVVVAPDGAHLWVVDNDGQRLLQHELAAGTWQVIGHEGESLGQFQYPFQIAALPEGDVVVSDVINARLQIFAPDGQPVRSIGSHGVEIGQFFRPGGLAIDRDRNLWVADSVLGVIQVFRADGLLIDVLRDEQGQVLHFNSPLGLAFEPGGSLCVVELAANQVARLAVSATQDAAPPLAPPRAGSGQQAQACTICHIDWLAPYADGRDSGLATRPEGTPEEPAASRSPMCLSCHDGAVADSRQRVWEEHGHRTGVAPPESMTVPQNLPLVDGKLACRTCHSAHGSDAAQGDFRRAMLLRVPNVASELCVSCHSDKTRGPRFGTHPTGGMPWPIPEPLVAAGAKVGPNPRELTCQVCHTPHGASYDHLLVLGVGSNQLCLTCHDQMRPGMFREGGDREHPLSPKTNPEQAAAIEDMGTRIGPAGELICLSCHKLHHGFGERFMLAAELKDGQMCIRCHSQRTDMLGSFHDLREKHPQERNRLGMTVSDGGPCSACHLFHRYAREPKPTAVDTVGECTTCHSQGQCAENRQLGSVNHPTLACLDCHDPHQVRFTNFLRAAPEDLCTTCHSEMNAVRAGPHDMLADPSRWLTEATNGGDRCLSCHRPHGNESTGLFRIAPVASAGPTNAPCAACHTNTLWGSSGAAVMLHPRDTDAAALASGLPLDTTGPGPAQIDCETCHDPHAGGATEHLVRLAGPHAAGQPCVACHAANAHVEANPHSGVSMRNAGFDSASCGPCHRVHANPAESRDKLLWSPVLAAAALSMVDNDTADPHCTGCHRKEGPARWPGSTSHPLVDAFDPLATSGVAHLPIYDADGNASASGRITCRTCHEPHGRIGPTLPGMPSALPGTTGRRLVLRSFVAPNVCTSCHGAEALNRFLYFHESPRRNFVMPGTR